MVVVLKLTYSSHIEVITCTCSEKGIKITLFTLQKHTLIHTQPMNYSLFRFLFRVIRLRSLETQI